MRSYEKWRPVGEVNTELKGSGRVLSKNLIQDDEDILEIPTFMRRPAFVEEKSL